MLEIKDNLRLSLSFELTIYRKVVTDDYSAMR